MNRFLKDRNYFLNYFLINIAVFGVLCIGLIIIRDDFLTYKFDLYHLFMIPFGLVFGLIVATAFHNTSHGNIRPRFLNTIVGEFCGAIALDGMRNFRVGHMLHHKYSDDPLKDPHPPHGLSFIEFIRVSKKRTIEVLISEYYRKFGDNSKSRRNIKWQLLSYKIGFFLKISFWFLLLGPIGFLFFYVPTFSSYFFGFAHLNYISHDLDDNGNEVMFNNDGGVFYTIMNFLTSGGYYHKNHHRYPGLYNPKRVDLLKSRNVSPQTP